ncbi:NADPH:quinone reductase [Microbacterium sorbitolivorans]|uniref:NADP-dependent oxidoreductase n=1 Tax=Microbacterium sorbitolivorans TaxID=1867410 RepID=A0A367Y292_9MICO|nr:NADP-dependent oxidoreductase [Microbacterium sorbitolivorans]RCK59947.1 NADP-dependent oxidoreductase [Microbacterium sorbitolivorans]GGF41329.1 NADPH:quinone reductase [Microbacterium sorbitolivorans]
MSRFVQQQVIGDPIELEIVERDEPHAGPGEVRVRVRAAGLNPVDWKVAASPEVAGYFGVTAPSGFGNDFAGVIDEVGDGVDDFAVGDRVFGGARGRALAEHVIVRVGSDTLVRTPDAVSDEVASTLAIAGRTAAATLAAVGVTAPGAAPAPDATAPNTALTLLVGGAAGGVGVFVVQLAVAAGATVIATASPANHDFLRDLGAIPTTYGEGLADRIRELAPRVDAAIDLQGTATVEAALELGVAPERIATIAAGPTPPGGAVATGGSDADPGALARIADAIAAGSLIVPIQQVFPLEGIDEAIAVLRGGHVRGKVVVTV